MSDVSESSENVRGSRLTRRELIKRAAIVGGVAAWGAPLVRLTLDDDQRAVRLGAENASSEGPAAAIFGCGPLSLTDGVTVRVICAKNNAGAVTSYTSKVKAECEAKCGTATGCGTSSCRTNKKSPTNALVVVCTELLNPLLCPPDLYGRGMKPFSCVATVVCNCECR